MLTLLKTISAGKILIMRLNFKDELRVRQISIMKFSLNIKSKITMLDLSFVHTVGQK